MSEIKNIPRLRFPEFHGEWIESLLGDIAKFSKGKGISKSDIFDNGEYECIRYGELYTHYNEVIDKVISKTDFNNNPVLSEINDVIIPASGETALDIATASCVLKSDVLLGGDLNIIRSKVNGVFLSYYLNNKRKKEIARLSQGNSVVHVYPSQLKTLKIFIPQTTEYDEIAEFLTVVDKRIYLLEKKKNLLETYKKGVMKKIFNQEIRFKDDNGNDFPDWEEKRLGEICKLQGGYAFKSNSFKDTGIPIIRISNISNDNNYLNLENLVHYEEISNEENFTVLKGDLLIAMSGATTGKTSISNYDGKCYLNQRVGLFKSKTDKLNYSYLVQFVYSPMFGSQLVRFLVAGAQPNISSKDIESVRIPFPLIIEQQKISQFLSSIDTQLKLIETQIDKSKTWKKGLLQKMFV